MVPLAQKKDLNKNKYFELLNHKFMPGLETFYVLNSTTEPVTY